MRIRVQGSGPGRDTDFRRSIGRCFRQAMDRFASRVRSVLVYVVQVNTPSAEESLYCRAIARLRPGGTLVVDNRDRTAPATVAQTAARLAAVVARRLRPGKAPVCTPKSKRMLARRPGSPFRIARGWRRQGVSVS